MKSLTLRLSSGRVSRIWVGSDLLTPAAKIWKQDPLFQEGGRAFIIRDSKLGSITSQLQRSLKKAGWDVEVYPVRARESSKSFAELEKISRWLIRSGADRSSVIFAVGGGVIGDLSGFVAATYMRGIRWVGVPTTLLAQVDSSLGGKTAVNHAMGKNLIGAFHQPSSVICDLNALRSLPPRDWNSGLGEVLKYGLLSSDGFFSALEKNLDSPFSQDSKALMNAVWQCVKMKARVVRLDEFETRGLRTSLNLGHTVGHALEAATNYDYFRHGEAVGYGLRAMLELSYLRGHLSLTERDRILLGLRKLSLPPLPRSIGLSEVVRLTYRDKKSNCGKRRFVLLSRLGKTVLDDRVTDSQLRQALQSIGFRTHSKHRRRGARDTEKKADSHSWT